MFPKVTTLEEIEKIMEEEKKKGRKIVQCHGVFDLLHPGHIRHFKEAKGLGDTLVVTVTPDKFVNKGPGRPFFTEKLRLEQLASLAFVDYVVLNDSKDAVSAIEKVRPHIYVKGMEYKNHDEDVTGKIYEESSTVEKLGGFVHYTNDIVFSSSSLLNKFFDDDQGRIQPFLESFKKKFSFQQVLEKVEKLATLDILLIGDAIIDEYQYVMPLGQSGKGVHMTSRLLEKETFLGGSLIIANHLASFVKSVTLLTSLGEECLYQDFIDKNLKKNVIRKFFYHKKFPTLCKKRYVLKDGNVLTKLFETYSSNDPLLEPSETASIVDFLKNNTSFDAILSSDFGNGFLNEEIVQALSEAKSFLAVNTQTNSGNRGFHVVTHYPRADFISLNEPEIRLAAHDRSSPLETVVHEIQKALKCPQISVTMGVNGMRFFVDDSVISIPALTTHAIDRVGAGDSYFALTSLAASMGYPSLLSGFLGSVAAAMDVQIIGNKESIEKAAFCKYITRLLK